MVAKGTGLPSVSKTLPGTVLVWEKPVREIHRSIPIMNESFLIMKVLEINEYGRYEAISGGE
jgi:hypothetical protein